MSLLTVRRLFGLQKTILHRATFATNPSFLPKNPESNESKALNPFSGRPVAFNGKRCDVYRSEINLLLTKYMDQTSAKSVEISQEDLLYLSSIPTFLVKKSPDKIEPFVQHGLVTFHENILTSYSKDSSADRAELCSIFYYLSKMDNITNGAVSKTIGIEGIFRIPKIVIGKRAPITLTSFEQLVTALQRCVRNLPQSEALAELKPLHPELASSLKSYVRSKEISRHRFNLGLRTIHGLVCELMVPIPSHDIDEVARFAFKCYLASQSHSGLSSELSMRICVYKFAESFLKLGVREQSPGFLFIDKWLSDWNAVKPLMKNPPFLAKYYCLFGSMCMKYNRLPQFFAIEDQWIKVMREYRQLLNDEYIQTLASAVDLAAKEHSDFSHFSETFREEINCLLKTS